MNQDFIVSPRVVIIGSSCAGKSTFAQALAKARSCPCIELDELFWGPDWTPKPSADFLRLVTEAAAGDTWVASGNYGTSREILWARATTIVWLNFSLPRVLWRGLRRTVGRVVSGRELFHGNRESFRQAFLSRESILWWIVSTFARRRLEFEALRASGQFAHETWLEARTPAEAAEILAALSAGRP
ncbi:MAG TPA: toxin [Candidatus Aquabacterium excrementipullorum]|nr:toxin [Candidatus Aquabacterium excrementipullorum]